MARKHLIPDLGWIPLQQLTDTHLESYYADKLSSGRRDGQGGLSPRTVRHHHRLLHVLLEWAVKQILSNVTYLILPMLPNSDRKK